MRLIQKIKSYYIRHEFYLWQDFNPSRGGLSFIEADDEVLMDIGRFIKQEIIPAKEAACDRHRLLLGTALTMDSIDEVLLLIRSIINADLEETKIESGLYNWDFYYQCDLHPKCDNTITISTVLKSNDKKGYCVYNVASVRLSNEVYYCWSHLK